MSTMSLVSSIHLEGPYLFPGNVIGKRLREVESWYEIYCSISRTHLIILKNLTFQIFYIYSKEDQN